MKAKKPAKIQWIPVVAGVLRKDNLILLGQRPEGNHLAGHWEFPGGKIEAGESPEQALQRELKEELEIQCEVGPLLLAITHVYEKVHILILFYEVLFWKGEPQARHHMSLQWVPLSEMDRLPVPEANRKVFPLLEKKLGKTWAKS